MGNKKNKICYMCGCSATSREHVPPICLFPEEKDIKTSVFRNNLITVPSCDLHNSKKSNDDEFLMACMSGIVGNNVIGFFHFSTKVKRSLERKGRGVELLMNSPQFSNIKNSSGHDMSVVIGRPDLKRLRSCFLHIAYGLYYHKFSKVFDGECEMIMDFVTYEDAQLESYKLLCRKLLELDQSSGKESGANQEIFSYKFSDPDQFGLILLKITFYGATSVFIAFKGKEAKEPRDFIADAVKAGINTVVHFNDGSRIEFNNRFKVV